MSTKDPGLQLSVTAAVAMLVLVGASSWWLTFGDSAQAAKGRQLYLEQCSKCHGVDLQGEAD